MLLGCIDADRSHGLPNRKSLAFYKKPVTLILKRFLKCFVICLQNAFIHQNARKMTHMILEDCLLREIHRPGYRNVGQFFGFRFPMFNAGKMTMPKKISNVHWGKSPRNRSQRLLNPSLGKSLRLRPRPMFFF